MESRVVVAQQIKKLTARGVDAERKPGRHSDGGGLYLFVEKSGSKRWVFLFRQNGKLREMGLGGLSSVSLAMARGLAADYRKVKASGGDPRAERKARKGSVPTFGEFADKFIEAKKSGWRSDSSHAQWAMNLREYAAPLRGKPVDAITTEEVLRVLTPIWSTKQATASRLRRRIEMVLDAAKAAGHRSGENPARLRGHLALLLPKRQRLAKGHHAAMPYEDVPAFIAALRERPLVTALALEFLILTAARVGEVMNVVWPEIELDQTVWTVPRERMKAGREHRVPLSGRALEILAEVRKLQRSKFVFPGNRPHRPASARGVELLLGRMNAGGATVHGFRSSFRDWCGDATHFPREVAEAALAHATGDEKERAYRRGDALAKRRELMDLWARHCEPRSADVVIQFPRAQG